MTLEQDLLELDRGFWLEGEDFRLDHVDEQCLVDAPQMQGVYSRAEVAAFAPERGSWTTLSIEDASMLRASDELAMINYEARVTRDTGEPYRSQVTSGYVLRGDGWKLGFHQHSALVPDPAN